jgi:uncharacterized membrane protein
MRVVTNRAKAALLLVSLLVSVPVLAGLPNAIGAIRLAGLSLLWWYAGVLAPLAAVLGSLAWLPDPAPPARPE